ncbi:MAG: thioredoxin domain-containing protein, partial [Spirochaetia bacterium]
MSTLFDPRRNALDEAQSPYLRQHRHNPVHWQQWSNEAFDYAAEHDLIVFVSVGYSTCHWCHVMAEGAFSHPDVAAYLNRHFVSIKVDREERPDIDQYLMSFLVDTTGQGGWPLNAFLSPKQETFFAMTYAPAPDDPRAGTMMSFDAVLERVHEFYHQKKDQLGVYEPSRGTGASPGSISLTDKIDLGDVHPAGVDIAPIVDTISSAYDWQWGGFGGGPKFPPHSTLLWMLNAHAAARSGGAPPASPEAGADEDTPARLEDMLRLLLDTMARRGLHDHLQGGFYRYCVDGRWTIPHFEEMLYDQALLLWAYASAAFELGEPRYAAVAAGIVRCLNETFLEGNHGSEGQLFL